MEPRKSTTGLFLKQARRDFLHTGAIAPSSRFLARAIASSINLKGRPVSVLEAGAGTGALTREIIRRLPAGSRLDIYEINPTFARHLEEAFDGASGQNPRRIEVRVHNRRVQELPADAAYDHIVSGLPFNNFDKPLVKEILGGLVAALRPGGTLSYFEYIFIRELKALASRRTEKRRLRSIGRVTGQFIRRYEFSREAVLLNIPPAFVHHLRRPAREKGV